MAIANLVVRIAADVADFEKNIKGVERSLSKTGRELENIGSKLTRGLTLPLVAGIGLAAKAAIDFESSFAGVRKTVDATEAQFKDLEGQFRNLARVMPLSVNEINKVAESAGQLGVKREQIVGFTEAMVKLGTATNLTADEAATSMARFANAIGEPQIDINKLGSALVALGNAGASTEKDILDMAGRIAGAGSNIKLTAGSIFGMANALSSVGIEAEKGGSAISRLFNDLNSSVSSGGKELENFAAVAGQSGQAFASLFKQDSAAAITSFIEGLHAQKAAGADLLKILNELGITELRYRDTVLLAANAGPQFAASIKLGNEAFAEGSALTKEYNERLKTTASQLQIFRNSLNDILITLGKGFLPIINDSVKALKPFVERLAEAGEAFQELPQGVRAAGLAFAGLLASLGPVLFAIGAISNAASGVVRAFRFLIPEVSAAALAAKNASGVFSGLFGTLVKFAGPIALTVGALVALQQGFEAFNKSAADGLIALGSLIPGFTLLLGVGNKLLDTFPRLRGVFDDLVSILENSAILIFREMEKAFEDLGAATRRLVQVVGRELQPILDAINVSWDRVAKVLKGTVIPAIEVVAFAFLSSIPAIRDFLILLSAVPGFGDIEQSLDRVAKKLQGMVDESNRAKDGISGLGVVFKGGAIGIDAWGKAIDGTKNNLTGASTASIAFGTAVQNDVVKPLKLGGTAVDEFAKKVKDLQDSINGVDLVNKAKLWAAALKATGAEAKVLADSRLRRELLDVVDDVERKFGSLKNAGVGSLTEISGAAKALELAMEPLANIPIHFEIKGLGQPGSLLGDIIPQVGRTSLMAPLIESLEADFKRIDADTLGATEAIKRVKAGMQREIEAGDKPSFIKGFFADFGKIDLRQEAQRGAQNLVGALGEAIGSGDFSRVGDQIKKTIAQFMGSAIGAGINVLVPGLGTLLQPLFAGLSEAFINLFGGGSKGRHLIIDFADTFGGFKEFRDKLIKELGGVNAEKLFAQIAKVGRNNAKQAQQAIDDVNAALERAAKGWESLLGTINNRANVLIAPLDKIKDQLANLGPDDTGNKFVQLTEEMTNAVLRAQPEFERLGQFAIAAFAGAIKHGSSALDVLKELEPTLSVLSRGVNEFGLSGSDAIDKLLGIREFVIANQQALDAIAADQQILSAFNDTGILTRDLFQSIGADIGAQFQRIAENGGDMAQALALSQPVLQQLWEAQQTFGNITDESTAAILRQAEQQGLVGAHMRDVNERILDVLLAIADALGAKIPEALRGASRAADQEGDKIQRKFFNVATGISSDFKRSVDDMNREFARIGVDPITVPVRFEVDPDLNIDGGENPFGDITGGFRFPRLASGGIVRRPTLALVGEAGPEAVVPLSQGFSVDGPEAGNTTVILEVDGRTLAEVTAPHLPGVARKYVRA